MKNPGSPMLAGLALSVLCLACQVVLAEASSQPAQDANQAGTQDANKVQVKQSGWLSLGTTFVSTTGNDQEFRQQKKMDDDFLFGVRSLGYSLRSDGWLVDVTGRAVCPFDYGADVKVQKEGIGFVEGYIDQFPSYYNTSHGFYPFAPKVYSFDKELATTRRDSGVKGAWNLGKDTTLEAQASHWERAGKFSTLSGGQAQTATTVFYRYPQFAQTDQHRDRLGLDLLEKLGRFNLKVGVEVSDFDGTTTLDNARFGSTGTLDQLRSIKTMPGWTELTPKVQLTGDLIEKILRLEYEGLYSRVETDGTMGTHTYDPNGNLTNASRGVNYVDNEHHGTVNETLHNLRLVYTPCDRWKLYGGVGFKYNEAHHDATLRQDTSAVPDGIADQITNIRTNDTYNVWMGNLGTEWRIADWLVAAAEGRLEEGELDRDWRTRQTLGGSETFRWSNEEDSERWEYGASLTAKPLKDLKLVGRWLETRVNNDFDNFKAVESGEPNPDLFRSMVNDNLREKDEWSILAQYKPSTNLQASYKLAVRSTDFLVEQNEPRLLSASQESVVNTVSVTILPTDKLSITAFGSYEELQTHTEALHNPKERIPGFNDDYTSWGIEPSLEVTKKLTVNGGFNQRLGSTGIVAETGRRIQSYRALDVYVGAVYKIDKTWSADCRYTFASYNESDNGGLDDFQGHIFTIGATARF